MPGSDLESLTDREGDVLDLLVQGLTNNQIAERLVISPNTVKRHLKAIFAKLGVSTRRGGRGEGVGGRGGREGNKPDLVAKAGLVLNS